MVNEEKVKVMTQLAIYEANEGKKHIPVYSYYKADYIRLHEIKTLVAVTFGYLFIIFGLILVKLEYILDRINQFDYKDLITKGIICYIIILVLSIAATRISASHRYERVHLGIYEYRLKLKKLRQFYSSEKDGQQDFDSERGHKIT